MIIRPGAIGDFILSLPALECLATADTEVWAASQNLPLVRFARARSLAASGLNMLEFSPDPALIEMLRSFDSIVSWYGTNRPEFRELIASLGLNFTFLTALPPDGCRMHAADFYLEQARALGACLGHGIPRLDCARIPGDFAVIHPFAGSRKKRWPLERFQDLARRMGTYLRVDWCAGPEDELSGAAVRIDNLYELACWIAGAQVYIGNDSGISHLAAAAGAPVVALFGPTNPSVWAPRGPRVEVIARQGMEQISVDDVEAAVRITLAQ